MRHSKQIIFSILLLALTASLFAQFSKQKNLSKYDTLRGSLNTQRNWWDVQYYDITVKPDIINQTIEGECVIDFKVLHSVTTMQIDFQSPMKIQKIFFENKELSFYQDSNVCFVNGFPRLKINDVYKISIHFKGKPRIAKRAPWDGGWLWKKDAKGNPWVSVACQGLGASVWFPCKDHQSDEPDKGASLSIIVPDSLKAIAMGRLKQTKQLGDGNTLYKWAVVNPINSYCIIPYIGKYVNVHEMYNGENGNLTVDYWVLENNFDKIKNHLQPEVQKMLKAMEWWLGPYPFYEDGYKLVEAQHLGMEHQSAIAYGNKFLFGYMGSDLSGSGWGKKWDYIVVHESGHEWFANNITTNDIADMWVHEGFTDYTETLYTEYYFGKNAGNEYVQGIRKNILNDKPIIGRYGINEEGSGDMYFKGANLIHTIRAIVDNDSLFRNLMRAMNKRFWHKTVNTEEIEGFISKMAKHDLSKVFDQYLRTTQIPRLEYYLEEKNGVVLLNYRWANCIKDFNMPIRLPAGDGKFGLFMATEMWQKFKTNYKAIADFSESYFDKNFYVIYKRVE